MCFLDCVVNTKNVSVSICIYREIFHMKKKQNVSNSMYLFSIIIVSKWIIFTNSIWMQKHEICATSPGRQLELVALQYISANGYKCETHAIDNNWSWFHVTNMFLCAHEPSLHIWGWSHTAHTLTSLLLFFTHRERFRSQRCSTFFLSGLKETEGLEKMGSDKERQHVRWYTQTSTCHTLWK